MPRLTAFEQVSLDGFFVDAKGDMSWAKKQDSEWNEFTAQNAGGGGVLVFGRVTYEMMASFWPTPQARASMPAVAEAMNTRAKVVFSRTLADAPWQNTRLVKGDMIAEVRRMKTEPGPDMVILGSGSVVSQLAEAGMIDDLQIVVNPIVLGRGRTLFSTVTRQVPLKRVGVRPFTNGNVVVNYQPAGSTR